MGRLVFLPRLQFLLSLQNAETQACTARLAEKEKVFRSMKKRLDRKKDKLQKNFQKEMFRINKDRQMAEKTENKSESKSCGSYLLLNDNKAGMQGLDKEKINKIIYEASKGSKYFENEQRKDERLKERIDAMKLELASYTESDFKCASNQADATVSSLAKKIDLSRTIVHIDMDMFYAAVEMRDNPKLKSLPMAVGGNSMLSTSNYIARRYGVRAAMPGFIAKKLCPKLVIVPPHFDKYKAVSQQVQEIFKEYDPNYSMLSLDEAYLDLTEYLESLTISGGTNAENVGGCETRSLAEIVVAEIRAKIEEKTSLTASAGIACNTMLSKICSDINKPDGQFYLKSDHSEMMGFMCDLSIRKVCGVGKVTEQMLRSIDVFTCKDLFDKRALLLLLFSEGSFQHFMQIYLASSANRIEHGERKSMSVERTFADISDKSELVGTCESMCSSLAEDLEKHQLSGRTVSIKYKLSTFVTKTRAKSVGYSVSSKEDIFAIAKELLLFDLKSYKPGEFVLRLFGVRMSQFDNINENKQKTVDKFFRDAKLKQNDNQVECPLCFRQFATSKIQSHAETCLLDMNNPSLPADKNCDHWPSSDSTSTSICSEVANSSEIIEKDNLARNETLKQNSVQCPICCKSVVESDINEHVDLCLTKQTVTDLVKETTGSEENNFKNTILKNEEGKENAEKSKKRKAQSSSSPRKKTLHSYWQK